MGNSENRDGATECWLLCYASARNEDRRCQFITRPVGRLTKLWISDRKSSRHGGRRQCFSHGRRLFETSRSRPREVNAHCAHFSRRSQPQMYYKYVSITISASKYRICMSTWPSYASGKPNALLSKCRPIPRYASVSFDEYLVNRLTLPAKCVIICDMYWNSASRETNQIQWHTKNV